MSVVDINTSQNVSINFSVASVAERLIAIFLDLVIQGTYISIMIFVLFGGFSAFGSSSSFSQVTVVVGICFVALPVVTYHLWTEFFLKGRSVGKMVMNLQVVMIDGSEPSFLNFFSRWILRILDISLFSGLVALLALMASSKGQRLGDIAAGTTVIKQRRKHFGMSSANMLNQEAEYTAHFPQVINLKDKDLTLIKEVLSRETEGRNAMLVEATAQKVKSLLQLDADMDDTSFLETVVKDYNYLAGNL